MKILATEYISFAPFGDHLIAIFCSGTLLLSLQLLVLLKKTKNKESTISTLSLLFFLGSTFWFAWTSFHEPVDIDRAEAIFGTITEVSYRPSPFTFSTWAYLILLSSVGPLVTLIKKIFQPGSSHNVGKRSPLS